MNRPRSTYHAVCLCGADVSSQTTETTCPHCERVLIFEWGRDAVVFHPASAVEPAQPAEEAKPKTQGAAA